ncbi:hypothetical protein Dimus_026356, partial [Dionaea muscipula]
SQGSLPINTPAGMALLILFSQFRADFDLADFDWAEAFWILQLFGGQKLLRKGIPLDRAN